jgi:hypothetical protein
MASKCISVLAVSFAWLRENDAGRTLGPISHYSRKK